MREWIGGLERRERLFLTWGGIITIALMIYLFALEPLGEGINQKEVQIANQQQQLLKLQKLVNEYKKIGPGNGQAAQKNSSASMLSLIDLTSTKFGLKSSVKRITPDGKNKVRIRLENATFDKVVSWLVTLAKEYRINVETLNLRPNEAQGSVNGNLTLRRV